MKIVAWPKEEGVGAREYEIESLGAFWELVTARAEGNDGARWVHEISANLDEDENPYFVLSWVEVEDQ